MLFNEERIDLSINAFGETGYLHAENQEWKKKRRESIRKRKSRKMHTERRIKPSVGEGQGEGKKKALCCFQCLTSLLK